jgi:hypothetical protein
MRKGAPARARKKRAAGIRPDFATRWPALQLAVLVEGLANRPTGERRAAPRGRISATRLHDVISIRRSATVHCGVAYGLASPVPAGLYHGTLDVLSSPLQTVSETVTESATQRGL